MSEKTIKYAIQGAVCGKLAVLDSAQETLKSWAWSRSSGEPTLFDSFGVAVSKVARIGRHLGPITIVKVEVTPGETKREVVELEGVVDHSALHGYAVNVWSAGYTRLPDSHGRVHSTTTLSEAGVFTSACAAINAIGRDAAATAQSWNIQRIVGIREVTTPASYTIIPLD